CPGDSRTRAVDRARPPRPAAARGGPLPGLSVREGRDARRGGDRTARRPRRARGRNSLIAMRVLLVSTYELGHQPLHVASPAGRLRSAGHDVRCLDLSVEPWEPDLVDWADAVGFSVPMHTAMRLAMRAASAVRRQR